MTEFHKDKEEANVEESQLPHIAPTTTSSPPPAATASAPSLVELPVEVKKKLRTRHDGLSGRWICLRCGWRWDNYSGKPVPPRICAHCRSPYWDRPRDYSADPNYLDRERDAVIRRRHSRKMSKLRALAEELGAKVIWPQDEIAATPSPPKYTGPIPPPPPPPRLNIPLPPAPSPELTHLAERREEEDR